MKNTLWLPVLVGKGRVVYTFMAWHCNSICEELGFLPGGGSNPLLDVVAQYLVMALSRFSSQPTLISGKSNAAQALDATEAARF